VLGEKVFTIGRLPDSDLPVDDALASRRHAEIRPEPDGYRVVDVGSLNGTTVNALPTKDHLLVDGDVIGVGAVAIRFEAS
jgi:pSer/pThr/pTyr-binding forkhead associated (FHA) protein